MITWRGLTTTGKALFGLIFLVLVLGVMLLFVGCSSPVIPHRVESREVAYEGTEQNAGVLIVTKAGAVLTERKKAQYDALVAVYGRGTEDYAITPPVRAGDGLERIAGRSVGFPEHGWVWRIDAEHLTWFITFRDWQRAARKPGK